MDCSGIALAVQQPLSQWTGAVGTLTVEIKAGLSSRPFVLAFPVICEHVLGVIRLKMM